MTVIPGLVFAGAYKVHRTEHWYILTVAGVEAKWERLAELLKLGSDYIRITRAKDIEIIHNA